MSGVAGRPRLRSGLRGFAAYRSADPPCQIKLNSNELGWKPSAALTGAIHRAAAEIELNRYPDRAAGRLRSALADFHGVEPERIVVGAGSNEVLEVLSLAYAGAGGRMGIFDPTYAMYPVLAETVAARLVRKRRGPDWLISTAGAAEMSAEAPQVVLLCSPNNPTGQSETESVVSDLAVRAPASLIAVDEAYAEFAPSDLMHLAIGAENVVSIRTFSKAWGLAALRVGYAVAPEAIAREVRELFLPYNVSAFSQAAALVALRHPEEMSARVEAVRSERDRLLSEMEQMPAIRVFPSDASFVLFQVRTTPESESSQEKQEDGRSEGGASGGDEVARLLWEGLVQRGVLIRDCTGWEGLDGCLRVTVGVPEENERFLEALGEVCAELETVSEVSRR